MSYVPERSATFSQATQERGWVREVVLQLHAQTKEEGSDVGERRGEREKVVACRWYLKAELRDSGLQKEGEEKERRITFPSCLCSRIHHLWPATRCASFT